MNIIKQAKESYAQIGQVWCPALESFISFGDDGFHHLIWKNRKHRSKADQRRRFRLLKYTGNIVASTKTNIAYQEKEVALFHVAYWAFTQEQDDQTLTVVVRKVGNGEKHFYSVFNKA